MPRYLNFVTPDPEPKPDPKPDPIEERFKALEERTIAAEAKANAAHAELRRQKKEKPDDDDDELPEPKPKGKATAADKELDARVAKIEKSAEKTAKNAKRNALKSAFNDVGISGEDQADAIDLFMARNADKLIYDDESDSVLVKDSEVDDPKPLSDYISAAAKAGKFKRYKAAPDLPKKGPTGGSGGSKTTGTMTLKDFQAAMQSGSIPRAELEKIQIEG